MAAYDPNTDPWLDAELRNVPVPDGLLERLARIPGPSDQELDERLRDVPLPPGFVRRLQRQADPAVRRVFLYRLALAASLLLVLWLSYTVAIMGFLVALSERPTPPPSLPVPKQMVDEQLAKTLPAPASPAARFEPARPPAVTRQDELATFDPARPIPTGESPVTSASAVSPLAEVEGTLRREGNKMDVLSDVNLARWSDIPASHTGFERLPELSSVEMWPNQGAPVPRVPAYNIAVLARWGVHPFASPLLASDVPLGVDASGYEAARRHFLAGEWPAPDSIRTEEFLAAVPCHFPAPTQESLQLGAFGGPNPFRFDGRQLLQVAVQAKDVSELPHPPTRLTLAVDISASMGRGGRLDVLRRAVERLVLRLGGEDRVSLVVFGERARTLCEDVGAGERDSLVHALRSVHAQDSTNLGGGLGLAYAVAQRRPSASSAVQCLVVLTDDQAQLERSSLYRMERQIAEAAVQGIRLHVIHLLREESAGECPWSQLVQAGGGTLYRAANADQVYWALLETLSGKPQLVARDARLRVVFNPKAVAAYRLVGHEARLLAGMKPARLEADFYAGQSASAVYEVLLLPNGESEVARAEIYWRHPDNAVLSSSSLVFRRGQFAGLWAKAPLSIQAAGVIAEAAEVLRGTPEVFVMPPFVRPRPSAGGLTHVLHIAKDVDPRLRSDPAFSDFVGVLTRAEALRARKSGGRK